MRSFLKIIPFRNGEITLSFTDVGKSCLSRDFLPWQIYPDAIRENKILTKICEFTVSDGVSVKIPVLKHV